MSIYLKNCFTKSDVTIKIRKRFVLMTACVCVLVYLMLSESPRSEDQTQNIDPAQHFTAFRAPSVHNNNNSSNILFAETSCLANEIRRVQGIRLSARQACAVESAARSNPHADVYLLHTCKVNARLLVGSKSYVRQLFAYPNVFAHHVDLLELLRDTPLEGWDTDELVVDSKYPVEHGSDVIRLAALWKYGGVYLDLDVVVLKSLKDLRTNFAAFETADVVAGGVLSFDARHKLVELCMNELWDTFNSELYGENGPKLLTRVLLRYCQVEQASDLTPEKCKGFTVYNSVYFYPIDFYDYFKYFDPEEDVPMELLKIESQSYVAHMWNYVSKNDKLLTDEVHIYGALAGKYCPNVYREAGPTF